MKTVELAGRSWQWADTDTTCFSYLSKHFGDVAEVMRHVPEDRRKVCVQAGGNFGVWPVLLSRYFERVITFEPEPVCFDCLLANTKDQLNVEAHRCGLGAETGTASIVMRQERNRGAQHLKYGEGEVPCMPLDEANLKVLDLLDLDIEGAEALALEGARETIRRCKPIIVVEDWRKNGHLGHHIINGICSISGAEWLGANGYRLVAQISQDKVFHPV